MERKEERRKVSVVKMRTREKGGEEGGGREEGEKGGGRRGKLTFVRAHRLAFH